MVCPPGTPHHSSTPESGVNETLVLHQVPDHPLEVILYEKSFNLKTISQGDVGHFREKNQIILSKVAKIALRDCF
jgi:hypothetical protein